LTEEQVKILKLTHRTIKDKKLADRIKAILSLPTYAFQCPFSLKQPYLSTPPLSS